MKKTFITIILIFLTVHLFSQNRIPKIERNGRIGMSFSRVIYSDYLEHSEDLNVMMRGTALGALGYFLNNIQLEVALTNIVSLQLQLVTKGYENYGYNHNNTLGYGGNFSPSVYLNGIFHLLDFPGLSRLNRYLDIYAGLGISFSCFLIYYPSPILPGIGSKIFTGINFRIFKHMFIGFEYEFAGYYYFGDYTEFYSYDFDDKKLINFGVSGHIGFSF